MKRAGVFRMLVARRFGGEEATPSDFFRLVERIASADGSSGWIASFGHAAIYLSALPSLRSRKIYASGPDVIMAGGIYPLQPAVPTEGGFKVDGRWSWASGCTAANLITCGHQRARRNRTGWPAAHGRAARRNGSRSSRTGTSMACREPAATTSSSGMSWSPRRGRSLRGAPSALEGPLFRYPTLALAAQSLAAVGLGTARAALDEVKAMAAGRASITGRRRCPNGTTSRPISPRPRRCCGRPAPSSTRRRMPPTTRCAAARGSARRAHAAPAECHARGKDRFRGRAHRLFDLRHRRAFSPTIRSPSRFRIPWS